MDGILEELLRLEDAKHHALIHCDSVAYDDCVRAQSTLVDDPRIASGARASADKLLAFSKLARINTSLYLNLLSTAPGTASPGGGYTVSGRIAETPVTRRVLAEV